MSKRGAPMIIIVAFFVCVCPSACQKMFVVVASVHEARVACEDNNAHEQHNDCSFW